MAKTKETPEMDKAAGEQTPSASRTSPDPNVKTVPELLSLSELADRHRLTTWQQAALARMMGWADGKKVSETEYTAALSSLKNRRLGGGRVE